MTETRFTWRWLIVIALVGIAMGLVVGLTAGWLIAPNLTASNPAGLSATAQNDYIVLVANTYSYDQDLPRARQRLTQLQDKDLVPRVERLAKALAARNDPSAANVADLALALGSSSSELIPLAEIAANDGWGADAGFVQELEPTKIARAGDPDTVKQQPATQAEATEIPLSNDDSDPPATPEKLKPQQATRAARLTATAVAAQAQPTDSPAPTNAPEPTDVPAPAAEPTDAPPPPPPTAEPTAVPAAPAPAPVTTEFIPGFPGGWPDSANFFPANVAAGQPYWRLKWARYCDWAPTDAFNPCEGFPGGSDGVGIFIMVVDESGNCVDTPLTVTLNNGADHPMTPDMLKNISYPWNPFGFGCSLDYEKEMYGEGNDISVPGLPSDKITGLTLCPKNPPAGYNPPLCGHAHVRYFLIFQRATR